MSQDDTGVYANDLYRITSQEVQGTLAGIRSDISSWANSASSALQATQTFLQGLQADPVNNFSVTVSGEISAFDAEMPTIEATFEDVTCEIDDYAGPDSIDPVDNPAASPTITLDAITPEQASWTQPDGVEPMESVGDLTVSSFSFSDPGGEPSGDIDDVADFEEPDDFSPDAAFDIGDADTPEQPDIESLDPCDVSAPEYPLPTARTVPAARGYAPSRITVGNLGNVPDFEGPDIEYDFTGEPDAFDGESPGDAPDVEGVTIPDYEGPADPPDPTLIDIRVPTIRDLPLPEIDIPISIGDLPQLAASVEYADPGYSDEQVDQLRTEISRVLNGDLGIPAHLWDAIWDKATHQIIRTAVTREYQGRQSWAKLGWTMPGGVALAQAEQAQFDINEQASEKAREIAVQRATMEREDFWNAVQHGVAFQKVMMDLYNAQEERALKAQIAMVEAMVNIYNANVANYNAKLQKIQTIAATKELELKRALSQLDVDKARLDGAKIRSEINEQTVKVYIAKWEGVKAAVEKYKTLVDAKRAELDTQRATVEVYGEKVKAYAAYVGAWAKQWDGYAAKMDAQKAKAATYEAEARAFSARVQGFTAKADIEKMSVTAQIEAERLMLEGAVADVERYKADMQGVMAELDSQAKAAAASAQAHDSRTRALVAGNEAKATMAKAKADVYGVGGQIFASTMQGYASRNQALATAWQAEAARYSAEAEGAKAAVSASAEKARAQGQRLQAQASAYTAKVEAEKAAALVTGRLADAQIAAFRAETDAKRTRVDTNVARLNAELRSAEVALSYTQANASMAAEGLRANAQGLQAQAGAYQSGASAAASMTDAKAKVAQVAASVFDTKARMKEAGIRAQASVNSAKAEVEAAKARAYASQADIAKSKTQASAIEFEAMAKQAELDQRAMIEQARISVQQAIGITQAQVQGLNALGQAYAQLCAGAYAAANVSAGINASAAGQTSSSYSTSVNHNYEYDVAGDGPQ